MDDPEMRNADFVVCLPADRPLMLPDNMVSVCCHCGRAVQHRPTVPREVRKLCVECGYDGMMKDQDATLKVTKAQEREIAAFLKRRHH